MLFQSIFIAILGSSVAYFFQQRAWQHRRREEIRQLETSECLALIDELARAIGRRNMAIRQFMTAIDSNSVSSEADSSYRNSVVSWMSDFVSFKYRIQNYFGDDAAREFEEEIHGSLRNVSDVVLRTYKYGINNLSREHAREHKNARSSLFVANYAANRFIKELIERVSNGEMGITELYDNVEVGKLEWISSTYLVYRLFGLAS